MRKFFLGKTNDVSVVNEREHTTNDNLRLMSKNTKTKPMSSQTKPAANGD